MAISARLTWQAPIEVIVTRHRRLTLSGDIRAVPTKRGVYVFARRSSSTIVPLYIGLASRSLRQRLKQHLKSPKMVKGLSDGPRGKRLFFFAELKPGDLESAKQLLPSIESALIRAAVKIGGATLNTHQRERRPTQSGLRCTFLNNGYREAWSTWSGRRVTTVLLPPRQAARRITAGEADADCSTTLPLQHGPRSLPLIR